MIDPAGLTNNDASRLITAARSVLNVGATALPSGFPARRLTLRELPVPRGFGPSRHDCEKDPDGSADFRDTLDVISAMAVPMYRMRDGPEAQGDLPGDIANDYDDARLLHGFIARTATPRFYNAIEQSSLDDLFGKLVLPWPAPPT